MANDIFSAESGVTSGPVPMTPETRDYVAGRIAEEAERRLARTAEFIVTAQGEEIRLARVAELTEIVRCRDCRYYEDGGNNFAVPRQCLLLGCHLEGGSSFCAWGERREA